MDIIQFFGRFHVLVLHLPIGILMLSALMEIYANVKNKPRNALLDWVWFWGAISAIAACILGWMLSQDDGYNSDAIFIHRTFGISVAVLAVICWLSFSRNIPKWLINALATVQLLLLFSTGHYGANMTHGETYLVEHAPNSVRYIMGFEPHAEPRPAIEKLDDALVYEDLIAPVLQKRCASCHNDSKQKGKLNLANLAATLEGGRSGAALIANDLDKSILYQRITLPHSDKKFMPAEGKTPLSDEQVAAFAWWINAGLPVTGKIVDYKMNKDQRSVLQAALGLTPSEFDLPPAPTLTNDEYTSLLAAGFVVKQITQTLNYLSIDFSSSQAVFTQEKLDLLLNIKERIVALNLRGANITADLSVGLPQFTHLKHLRLDHTQISDNIVEAAATLPSLSYLNLYNTKITRASLAMFVTYPALQQLYLGETALSVDAINSLKQTTDIKIYATTFVGASEKNNKS